MVNDDWLSNDTREEIYQKYENYYDLFKALSYSNDISMLSCRKSDTSFSVQELELMLKMRQAFAIGQLGKETIRNTFNQLAEWFLCSECAIARCDYLFIQALISFICDQIKDNFYEDDLDATTRNNLSKLAKISVSMAEFYSNRSTQYQDVQLPYDALEYYIEKRNDNLYALLYSLGSLTSKSKDELIRKILNKIKKEYLYQPPLDNDGFKNLYEYLGYINYYGNDHLLYQIVFDDLHNDIHCEVYHLPLPDKVKLLEDNICQIVDNGDMQDIESWVDFESAIVESDEFNQLIKEIEKKFMRGVPEYFPD